MTKRSRALLAVLASATMLSACRSQVPAGPRAAAPGAGAESAMRASDHLIGKRETHFKHLWQVTFGGENTRPRWSPDGKQLAYLCADLAGGIECEQVRIHDLQTGGLRQVSTGAGVNGLGDFMAGANQVLFASTHGTESRCPTPPDHSRGYAWGLPPSYDLYVADLESGSLSPLVTEPGYDAEPCISPLGSPVVFSSRRSGDLELWSCNRAGAELQQITDRPGYEGSPRFSPDGTHLTFHTTTFDTGAEETQLADYRQRLARSTTAPVAMEIGIMRLDGSERHQVTTLGKANWDPCFTPDGRRLLFTSNHHGEGAMPTGFDLFLVALDGSGLERVTSFDKGLGRQYDGYACFSSDGRFLAFSSNRGDGEIGETNVFIAEWQ